jgi:predicted PurR-regulated permease PerM
VDRVVRFVLILAAIGVIGWLLWLFSGLVIYLVVGALLAYLLQPIVYRIEGLGLGRISAILITFLVVFGAVSILITNLVPFVASQVRELSQQVSAEGISSVAGEIERFFGQIFEIPPGTIINRINEVFETLFLGEKFTETVGSVVDIFTDIFYAVLIIPFVTFFFLKDGLYIRQNLLRLVPNRYFEVTLTVIEKVEKNLGRYFKGLLIQYVSIGLVASVLLYAVGLQYAVAVGIFAGLANTIPYFGPLMGFLAGGLVSIAETGNFSMIPSVFIAMGLTQVADNLFFQPIIFSRAAQTHPLLILFVVLIGAQLGGIVGMLIAIPLTTTIRVGVEQVLWSLRNYRILKVA